MSALTDFLVTVECRCSCFSVDGKAPLLATSLVLLRTGAPRPPGVLGVLVDLLKCFKIL